MFARMEMGSAPAVALSTICVCVMALVFFASNFVHYFEVHKEAHMAVNAAALKAAREMARIVVDGNFGPVALVDDAPPDGNYNKRSVLGINTIFATIRLDLVIARQLNNTTMIYMARQDLQRAREDADRLAQAIAAAANGEMARDKCGLPVDLRKSVLDAYNLSSARLAHERPPLPAGKLKLRVGHLIAGGGETNIPCPQPSFVDPESDNETASIQRGAQRFYRPYTEVDTTFAGVNIPFVFAAVGEEPKLVSNENFRLSLSGLPPSVVQVTAEEAVPHLLQNGPRRRPLTALRVVATAQAGGQLRRVPSGGMYLSFPQGLPADKGSVDFTSVRSIINSSQLPAAAMETTAAPYTGWNFRGKGRYLEALRGCVPGEGRLEALKYLGRLDDDPSVSLAFMTWSWLRSLGLRPDVSAVNAALSMNLRRLASDFKPGSIYIPCSPCHAVALPQPSLSQIDPAAAGVIVNTEVAPQFECSEPPANPSPKFYFTVYGDVNNRSHRGEGEIVIATPEESPLKDMRLMEGQVLYRMRDALRERDASGALRQWQVVARSHNAYPNRDQNGRATSYFNNVTADGAISTPEVKCVVQWILCPSGHDPFLADSR